MVEQCVDGGFATDHEVHDAFGETRFVEQLHQQARGERHALGWLQNEGVAASDRVG